MFRTSSVHRHEFSTVHTTLVYVIQVCCRPDPARKLSANLYDIPFLCVQWKTPDNRQRNCPKHAEFYCKNKFEKLVLLVGFIIRGLYLIVCVCVLIMTQWEGFSIYWSQDVERNKSGINLVVAESMDSPPLSNETVWRGHKLLASPFLCCMCDKSCWNCKTPIQSAYWLYRQHCYRFRLRYIFKSWSSVFGRNVENEQLNTIRCKSLEDRNLSNSSDGNG